MYRGHRYGQIQTKFGIELPNTTGEILGKFIFLFHPRGQNPLSMGQTCIEATFIDRIEINLTQSFRMLRGGLRRVNYLILPEGQNPFPVGLNPFPLCQTCIETTFAGRFEPNLTLSFRILRGNTKARQLCNFNRAISEVLTDWIILDVEAT
jgi:hypothetical protein